MKINGSIKLSFEKLSEKVISMKDDSYLRKPPVNLEPKQVIAINALSYSVDICEMAFDELLNELIIFKDPKSQKLLFPKIFSLVWTIINNSSLFRNILEKHFGVSCKDKYMREFNVAKRIRNTNQHIEDRIDEIFSFESLPIYGSLSWCKNIQNTNKIEQFFLYSGVFTSQNVKGQMVKCEKAKAERIINEIIFSSVTKENKSNYPTLTISIYNIMRDLNYWVKYLETEIEKNLEGMKNVETHNINLYVQLKSHSK